MKRIFTMLMYAAIMLLAANDLFSQTVVSSNLIKTFQISQIDSMYAANGIPNGILLPRYAIDVYKIVYNTVSYDSTPTIASGALILPHNPTCQMPLVSYQHGTTLKKTDVPSRLSSEFIIGAGMATDGYAVSMPDYLGLGDSPGLHPYIHANSEASAAIDMLRASKTVIAGHGLGLNGQLFLVGYSQGGHATMALHRKLEQDLSGEFTVTASAPMSGPYDVSGVQANVVSNDSVYSNPGYLPYLMAAYNEVYHLYNNDSNVYVAPYDTTLHPLLDGTHGMNTLNAAMPSIPNHIMIPLLLDSFRTDTAHYFRHALQKNDVYDWKPLAPLKMYYCEADEQVSYQNAFVAYDKFIQNGATHIYKQSSGNYDHYTCARYSLLFGKLWFDSLRTDKPFITKTIADESHTGAANGSVNITVSLWLPPLHYHWSNGDTTAQIEHLSAGTYYLTITNATGCNYTDSATVPLALGIAGVDASSGFTIYPNPFSGSTTITFNRSSQYMLELSDLNGQVLKREQVSGAVQFVLNQDDFSAGIYFMKVSCKEGVVFRKLVVY